MLLPLVIPALVINHEEGVGLRQGVVVAGGWTAWSLATPSTMSPTVLMLPRASSGISMLKASSTSKEMLILSRESMLSSSKVLAREMESAGMLFDFAMMSIQRVAMSFMLLRVLGDSLNLQGCEGRCKGYG